MELLNERMVEMANGVSGISGIGANTNIEALKEIVQEVVEEVLESKEAEKTQTEETVDEESGLVEEETESLAPQETKEENSLQGFAGLLTAMTNMMTTMMTAMMQMLGIAQNNKPEADDAVDNNTQTQETAQPHVYTKEEQEFLERYDYYLKDIVAEEKLTTDPEIAKSLLGSDYSWEEKIVLVANDVTDAEIEEYLQKHPNAITDAIVESRSWNGSTQALHGGYGLYNSKSNIGKAIALRR